MAEKPDDDSRTEEPTAKKLSDAIEHGNVPISREASAFASIAGLLIIVAFILRGSLAGMTASLAQFLNDPGGWSIRNGADATLLLSFLMWESFRCVVPIIGTLIVAGLAASFMQTPPRFVIERIRPDLSRLSLVDGWRRVFSAKGQVEFLKSAIKLISLSVVIMAIIHWSEDRLVNAMFLDPAAIPELILIVAMRLLSVICVVTVLIVAADLLFVRSHWRRDLRMSRHEVKEELKQLEGDPLIKSRLRSIALDRLRKNMIAAVPKATLVIANPTHYAIALRYVREEGGTPVVLSKGKDLLALKIREIAEEHFIPIIEDKSLARSMYDSVEVNRSIPPEFYRAVAELIHYIYAKDGRRNLVK
jgi:flagellar biosynthetic protein FlhB